MAHSNIRKFRLQDNAAVKLLVTSIMNKEFPHDALTYPSDDLDDIPGHYGNIGEAFFVAEDDKGNIIGTIAVKRDDERRALLRRFFVSPEYRGKNVGKALLEHLIGFCREVGYQEIIVKTTTRMERAIKICRDYGFSEKARVGLGATELCKLALFLRENSPLAS